MRIKLIDFGGKTPERAHYNDAGADVFARVHECMDSIVLPPHKVTKVPLGFGLELPDGFAAFVVPRSGMSTNKGITAEVIPIDSGYTGEVHAILYNANDDYYYVKDGEKVAQLVILPIVLADFTKEEAKTRGNKGFGSTGY